jgi:hypothetical protein
MADAGEKRIAIDINTITTTTIIATAADEYFNILKLFLHSSGTNGVTLQSQAANLAGKFDMVAQERFFLESADGVPLLRGITVGDDFKITTTAAVQLSGFAVYKLSN